MNEFGIFMISRILLFAVITSLFLAACGKDDKQELEELDLLGHGMPILIKAPPNPEIKKMDLLVQKDITVKKGEDFYLQIFEAVASSFNAGDVKEELLGAVKANPYFSEILHDEESGFIYKNEIDSSNVNYGFRYVRLQGDKEYIFQTGLIGTFTLDQVKVMYEAVK
jgi:hypothetical protein